MYTPTSTTTGNNNSNQPQQRGSNAKGYFVNYGDKKTFTNRIPDNIGNTGLSKIDNFISPLNKEFIIKNNEIETSVKVDFLNLDNLWHFQGGEIIKSIKQINL